MSQKEPKSIRFGRLLVVDYEHVHIAGAPTPNIHDRIQAQMLSCASVSSWSSNLERVAIRASISVTH